jgi:mono/diheme cytochrome c family protein
MRFSAVVLALGCVYGTVVGSAVSARVMQAKTKTTWDGVYTDAQAKRGESAYGDSCKSCHGADLMGIDTAPSLTGPEFNTDWNDLALDDLFERMRTTMPADGPGTLDRQKYADILAFILAKDGFPAGQTELPSENAALKGINFVAKKP